MSLLFIEESCIPRYVTIKFGPLSKLLMTSIVIINYRIPFFVIFVVYKFNFHIYYWFRWFKVQYEERNTTWRKYVVFMNNIYEKGYVFLVALVAENGSNSIAHCNNCPLPITATST